MEPKKVSGQGYHVGVLAADLENAFSKSAAGIFLVEYLYIF